MAQFGDRLFSKLAASLHEGGRFVIVDRWFDMGEEESAGRLAYLLRRSLADPGFSLQRLEAVQAGLGRAGLEPESVVELPYERLFVAQVVEELDA